MDTYRRHALIGVLALALLARLGLAAVSPLIADECFDYFLSRHSLAEILQFGRGENNPPFWRMLLHFWSDLGRDELLLRLPGVFFSCAAVGVAYLWRRSAGLALLLAACYPVWLVDASLRMYPLFGLCVVIACLDTAPAALLCLACLGLGLLHTLGAVVLVWLGLARLLQRRAVWPFVLGLVPSLLWMAYAAGSGKQSLLLRTSVQETLGWLPLSLPSFLTGVGVYPHAWVVEPVLWAIALRGWWSLRRQGWGAFLAGGLWLVFWLVAIYGSLRGVQNYQSRYVVPVAATFFLCLNEGLQGRWRAGLIGVLATLNVATMVRSWTDSFLWNQDWRSTVRFLQARAQPGDVLVACQPYSLVPVNFYLPDSGVRFSTNNAMMLQPSHPLWQNQLPLTAAALGPGLEQRLGNARVLLLLNQEGADGAPVRQWFNERYGLLDGLEQRTLSGWGNTSVYVLQKR